MILSRELHVLRRRGEQSEPLILSQKPHSVGSARKFVSPLRRKRNWLPEDLGAETLPRS